MKKLFLTFIAALCCTVMANAEDDFIVDGIRYYVTGTNPNNVEVAIYSYSGDIVIPATVSNGDITYCVTGIKSHAFAKCSNLNSVSLPEGLQSIGEHAFEDCSIAGVLIIPSTVTDIESYAFNNCSNLNSVSLPKGLKSIKQHTFYGCKNLQSVTFPEELQSIGIYAFYGCGIAGDITIPNTVTEIGELSFSRCSNLTSVSLPERLKTIEPFAFQYCTNLSSISLPEGLETISNHAFYSCENLTSVTIPITVTRIGYNAFYETTSLKEVLVYSDNLIEIENVWSKTIPTYVTGKSYESYKSGIFKDYNVKLLSDADNIGDVIKNLAGISDEKTDAVKSFLKVLDTMGTKQDGPALIVTDKDGKEVILYSPKSVEYIKVKE